MPAELPPTPKDLSRDLSGVLAAAWAEQETSVISPQMQALFMQAPASIAVSLGPSHRIVLQNEAHRLAVGRDMVGRVVAEGLPELVEQGYLLLLDRVYQTGEPYSAREAPTSFRSADGSRRVGYHNFIYQPLRDDTGQVRGLVYIGHEVTEMVKARQRAEELAESQLATIAALRASEALALRQMVELQSVYDHAPVGLCVLDTELRWVRINHRLAENNGLPSAAHIGRSIRELLPTVVERAEPELRHLLATGEPVLDIELRGETLARPGVQRTWVESFYPLFDGNRQVIGINVVSQEVTEERRRQRGMEILAAAGKVLTASSEMGGMLAGVLRLLLPDLATVALIDLAASEEALSPELHVACEDEVVEVRLREERRLRALTEEHPITRAHRSRRPFIVQERREVDASLGAGSEVLGLLEGLGLCSAIVTPLLARGRSLGVLTLASRHLLDEVDLALAEELGRRVGVAVESSMLFEMAQAERRRVEEANRAKDEFLGVVSHELRTPLTSILGWASMLRHRQLSDEMRQRGLETIERNARMQTQLIEDLLDITRITTGKLRLQVKPVDLARVVEASLDAVRPAAEAKGVRLEAEIDPAMGRVLGDAERLQQVVWNLLSNAVKFTEREGRVRIVLRQTASAAEIAVEDTGKGIDPLFLPFVFERFRQADTSTTRHHGGLGLGLTIVKHLVELHGGTVAALSGGAGQGAQFQVQLPLSLALLTEAPLLRAKPEGTAVEPLASSEHGVSGLRVLVVDDEPDARDLIAAVLGEHGMAVTCASSAAEALETLQKVRPDILVSDIGMPGQDGYSLIEQVRALPPEQGGRTPAVALTAYARVEDRTRALLSGFDMHLAKPVEPTELLSVLGSVAPA
ncbi:hybrid sensor histidine kinase/response regulator [Chondromyces apiculatus]|uniref:histidine kinase n=1 Tax=Chondromyces apiculatus DSM 436 TaxID=1192034 RepID=A0A017TAK9_9BACT|nr:ATP-binding protein [Chondromyces apiculatus]EYF06274.1 Hypothetical protein CAP_2152 [Chondromyces apiculatus DSM 436]